MISVYLNLPGNAEEAAKYYTKVFEAPEPYMMRFRDVPPEDLENVPKELHNLLAYANVKTFAGDVMLSDAMPGEPCAPSGAVYICLSHKDHDRLRKNFDALLEDGVMEMPLEPTFFSPLYGIVVDKFGFKWMIMSDEE